jgi:hypothetical protein
MPSIEYRPDRPKPYRARYWGPDGRLHSRSFARKDDAERWLTSEEASKLRGAWVDRRDVLVLLNPEYDPNTYSVANGEIMADFAVTQGRLTLDEVNAWTQNLYRLGEEGLYFFSLNRCLFLAHR